MNAPNQSGWKPGTPVESDNAMIGPETVTGNRALMLEEPLIFEIGSNETTGVDFDFAAKLDLAGVSLGRLFPENESLSNGLLVAVTETTSEEDIETLASALEEVLA